MEPYKKFLVPFDTTNLNIFMRNNSVKNRGENIVSDDEEELKSS